MSEKYDSSIGFLGFLQLIFIGFKIANFIDWSWFWVFSPFIFMALCLVIVIIFVAFFKS